MVDSSTHQEYQYLNLLENLLTNGIKKQNRTGVDALQLFGQQMIFNLSDGSFPLLTTKKMFWEGIVDEFVFFFSGVGNIDNLPKRSRHWWNKWITSEGDIGPIYPKQYRNFETKDGQSFDQLNHLIEQLKNDPNSRRHLLTSFNPGDIYWARKKNPQLLYPCHGLITQFSIDDGKLSLCTFQRSMDVALGGAVNIAHYGLLLYYLCNICNLKPGFLTYFMGDVHLYEFHIEQVKKQLQRRPFPWPTVQFGTTYKYEDVKIFNYQSHDSIKFPVAI